MERLKAALRGVITHKDSNTQFHVKTHSGCYHCSTLALYRKRPRTYFLKPGSFVGVLPLQGRKGQGIICQILGPQEDPYLASEAELGQEHECSLRPTIL